MTLKEYYLELFEHSLIVDYQKWRLKESDGSTYVSPTYSIENLNVFVTIQQKINGFNNPYVYTIYVDGRTKYGGAIFWWSKLHKYRKRLYRECIHDSDNIEKKAIETLLNILDKTRLRRKKLKRILKDEN